EYNLNGIIDPNLNKLTKANSSYLMENDLKELNEMQQYITFDTCDTNEKNIIQPEAQKDNEVTSEKNNLAMLEENFLEFNHISDLSPNNDIVCKPITMLVTTAVATSVVKKTIYKRNQYGQIWGLAHKATLLALKNKKEDIRTLVNDSMQIKDLVAINQQSVSITPNTIEQYVNQDNREEEQVYEVNEYTSTG
ncbi:24485_t:CDS:2, partial [Dentiscutata erythropus]